MLFKELGTSVMNAFCDIFWWKEGFRLRDLCMVFICTFYNNLVMHGTIEAGTISRGYVEHVFAIAIGVCLKYDPLNNGAGEIYVGQS